MSGSRYVEDLKQNLKRFSLDVYDDSDDGELEIYASGNGDESSVSDRRNSHSFAHAKSVSRSPTPNGIDSFSPYNSEIEQYKAEIRRLQQSEEEIRKLYVNYAALLKEKEDQICRLNQEYGNLKQDLDATKAAWNVSRNENGVSVIKGSGDQSPKRQHKSTTPVKNRYNGSQMQNGMGNGVMHAVIPDFKNSSREKELADLLEEKNRSLEVMQATHDSQIKQLRVELEQEHDKLAHIHLKLQEEQKVNESFREELRKLKMDKQKMSVEMNTVSRELNEKASEIRRLRIELSRREDEEEDDNLKNLRRVIATLEKENTDLKKNKNELQMALQMSRNSSPDKSSLDGKEEMEQTLQKLERELNETRCQRDKAQQELTRLKQHLLEKESEESEKMDEDNKIIEELREQNEYQRAQISHLERSLKQAIASQEEVRMTNNNDLQKSREMIEDLNKKLASFMNIIDSKNVELLNLQTALGQYYAEVEAKEHLEKQLALAREESAKLSELLRDAEQGTEASKKEKEEILAKLLQAERVFVEGKNRVNKLEEDNAKLRRALEQSMTRLNRMSMDSDYLVDRRIVIKLLVTYFQRNHSKEVLDLMVRMLGFSDEDKQRIGVAQQGGRGVVRGVLGLPVRLVGGILGGGSADVHANAASENQSFSDLWVDFLLKEAEEREKRESAEEIGRSNEDSQGRSPNAAGLGPVSSTARNESSGPDFSSMQNYSLHPQRNLQPFEHSDSSKFSTVPLTSVDSNSRISRLLQKH